MLPKTRLNFCLLFSFWYQYATYNRNFIIENFGSFMFRNRSVMVIEKPAEYHHIAAQVKSKPSPCLNAESELSRS